MSRIQQRMDYFKENPDKPYNIRYKIEEGKFAKDEVTEEQGLSQELIVISCITQPSGAYSQNWFTYNGMGKGMHHDDVFKAWILMAASLRLKEDLQANHREFCNTVYETWRSAILG